MTPEPPDDDKCQISMCNQTHFTYCPHCKLFVCIEHLNEHYANYRQEYQTLLNEGKQQHLCNKELLNEIDDEKQFLLQFFHREFQYFQSHEKYIQEKAIQTSIRPQDCADLRAHVVQSKEKRTKLKEILQQVHQIIENYRVESPNEPIVNEPPSLLTKVKKEEPVQLPKIPKSSPLAQFSIDYEEIDDDENADNNPTTTTIDEQPKPQPKLNGKTQDKSEKKSLTNGKTSNGGKSSKKETTNAKAKEASDQSMGSDMDSEEEDEEETDNDHSASDPDFGETRRTSRPSIRRGRDTSLKRPAVNHFQVDVCPLSDKRYGIDLSKHPLRHVPCTRHNIASISLFTHLRVFHCLSSKASLRLVRHIISNGTETDCDLFSQATESLVSILPKSYRGRCPLTRLGAFGLTKFHDIRLCHESQTHDNTGLLNHFVVYHCLSYPWANKLCNAMQSGDYDGSKHALFKPNEPIKAEKWLTNQGKLILAKRVTTNRKFRRKLNNVKRKM